MSDIGALKAEVIRALHDPRALCKSLGLDAGAKAQHHGLHIFCPNHSERSPSCSVTRAPEDHGIRVRCFGCGWTTDALGLIAKVRNLNMGGRDFVRVVREGAALAGLSQVVAAIDAPPDGKPVAKRKKPPAPRQTSPPPPPVNFPPSADIRTLWGDALKPAVDDTAWRYLTTRHIDPESAPVRVIHPEQWLPDWARFKGDAERSRSWLDTGHRVIVPVFDCNGIWQSVRAVRIIENETPKRLPPSGYSARGLVMANRAAIELLRGAAEHSRVVLVEGETDWLTWTARSDYPVIGVISGAWHAGFAKRLPFGCQIANRVHGDEAGQMFQAEIASTLDRSTRLLGVVA